MKRVTADAIKQGLAQAPGEVSFGVNLAVLSFNLTVPFTFSDRDAKIASQIVRILEEKRILYGPIEWEHLQHSVNSVLGLKERLIDSKLEVESDFLLERVKGMISAIHELLDMTNRLEMRGMSGYPSMATWSTDNYRLFDHALVRFRQAIAQELIPLIVRYKLSVSGELAQFLPCTSDFDSSLLQEREWP